MTDPIVPERVGDRPDRLPIRSMTDRKRIDDRSDRYPNETMTDPIDNRSEQ